MFSVSLGLNIFLSPFGRIMLIPIISNSGNEFMKKFENSSKLYSISSPLVSAWFTSGSTSFIM